MTNKDKYLKDNVDIEELRKDIESYISFYGGFDTKEFFEDESWCSQPTKTQPTLTEDERVKEMVYTKERKREVLATGYYFGLLYYVLSLGTHPTAYVKIPKDNWLCTVEKYDDIPIECHGGITFRDDHLHIGNNQEIEGDFIGWDYAHCADYAPYYDEVLSKDTHKWTTKEILEEVKEVCSQIVELGKKPHLTEDERVILRNIDPRVCNVIGRDKNTEELYLAYSKTAEMDDREYLFDIIYPTLFQFIQERRRIRDKRIIRR